MNADGNTRGSRRYVALDIHKHYSVIAGVDREGWLKKNLRASDHVVIESTTNAWHVYDLLSPLVERVVVANPAEVKQIANARVKTDNQDVIRLLRLLIAGMIPEVWVPPVEVRELRALISYRWRLVKMATAIQNRMHSLLHRHNPKPRVVGARAAEWLGEAAIEPGIENAAVGPRTY